MSLDWISSTKLLLEMSGNILLEVNRTNPSFAYENLRFNRNKDCDLVRSYFCTYLVPEDLSQVRYNARCVYPKCSIVAEKEKSQSSRILSSFQTSSFLLTLKKWGIVKSFPILGVSRY